MYILCNILLLIWRKRGVFILAPFVLRVFNFIIGHYERVSPVIDLLSLWDVPKVMHRFNTTNIVFKTKR